MIEELMKRAREESPSNISRLTKRLDLFLATVTILGAQWLFDHDHSFFAWSLLGNNFLTGLYIIAKGMRS